MLISMGHGRRIILPGEGGTESGTTPPATTPLAQVAPGAKMGRIASEGVEAGLSGTDAQSFGYMFPDAPGATGEDEATVNALKALADAMVETDGDPADADSSIAPVFTYFGQFIDHDITANTDRDAPQPNPVSEMTGPVVPPLPRETVVSSIMNLRNGSLRLDSLYGEGPSDTAFTIKMRNAMRDPDDRSKMRLGGLFDVGGDFNIPADGKADLPRLGDVLDDPASGLDQSDIDALPDDEKAGFMRNGSINRSMAVIGDGRNDENLLVAQLHLSFLRLHNAVADGLTGEIPDADTRFEEAKRRTIMIYQWLVVNVYCEKVCMKSVIDGVKSAGAPLYKAFRERVASEAPELPLALEFSVAVYRFGHSMVRASYDHNRNFGRPDGGDGDRRASFRELFAFTGGNGNGEEITGTSFDRLPSNWPVEWERFVHDDPHHGDHRARNIDTKLAPPLSDMFKESDDAGELGRILRNLAERNLRRSHRLNLPTGQGAVDAINAFDKAEEPESGWVEASVHKVKYTCDGPDVPEPGDQTDGIAPVPGSALGEGAAGDALEQGGMLDATPLWFYVLREAEVTEGDTLGPLGSRIVAEQLVGLVIGDTQSFWHEGSGDGGWSPSEMPVGGAAITDMASVMRASGLIA